MATPKFLRKKIRKLKRSWRRNSRFIIGSSVLLVIGAIGYAIHMQNERPVINPTAYTPLLNLIARAESNDNYNAYFGNATNKDVKFTDMSVGQVLAWQSDFVAQGHASCAVGRYQIIDTTLTGLVHQLSLNEHQKFDAPAQDRLAIALLERRGSIDYATRKLSPQQFAANLAKEWAGLPRVIGGDPNASYYAGDGLNKSRTSVDEVMKAIEPISTK